jgi:protein-disulfide isomerase
MVEFVVPKDKPEKKKAGKKKSQNTGSSFWLPFAIVLAGALVAGAVLFKDQLTGRPAGKAAPEDVNVLGETATPTPASDLKVNLENVPMLGEATASVTIVEFSDFQCPYCEQFFTLTWPQIKKEYVATGQVKYYFKNFPLTGIHKNASLAAEAALCAQDQEAFWAYHDQLFAQQGEWAEQASPAASFRKYASSVGLKAKDFASCLDSGKYAARVSAEVSEGQTLGITGTPSFVINGRLLVGAYPFAEFKKIIEPLLGK